MPRLRLLLHTLRRSFDGGAWHGPALADALVGVDADTALARPFAGAHSIWDLTHHVAAWTREVARRVAGAPPGLPAEGDWPAPVTSTDPTEREAAWQLVRDELTDARDMLLDVVAACPPDRLDERVGMAPGSALGAFVTFGEMLVGLAQHNAYHGGQIVLLRRAIAATRA